jgi:hypothetical protein
MRSGAPSRKRSRWAISAVSRGRGAAFTS